LWRDFLLIACPTLKLLSLIPLLILFGCKTADSKLPKPKSLVVKPIPKSNHILIQPLNDIGDGSISFLKSRIAAIYKAEVTILEPRQLPANAYYAPGKRYSADTLLVFL
jgi:hypothetical protein